jgi:hypothetical protein
VSAVNEKVSGIAISYHLKYIIGEEGSARFLSLSLLKFSFLSLMPEYPFFLYARI